MMTDNMDSEDIIEEMFACSSCAATTLCIIINSLNNNKNVGNKSP